MQILDLSQNTLESDSDEADPFGLTDGTAPAAEAAGTVTLNGLLFDTSKTYIVPLTLKNAHNLEQDSAAVACPGKFGTLTLDADGTPKLSTNLRSVTVGTLPIMPMISRSIREQSRLGRRWLRISWQHRR